MRFDLTVPLARYVAMRERELAFPFRRYQIQRVWRGETPQARKGRFREFYQCDIDIINREKLSYLAEAEIPSVIYSVFREMAIGEFPIRINNRKVLKGLLQEFRVEESAPPRCCALSTRSKRKTAPRSGRTSSATGSRAPAPRLFGLISSRRGTDEDAFGAAGNEGLRARTPGAAPDRRGDPAVRRAGFGFAVDLGVVRGLDYYTGTIYETTLAAYPELGSICSGGATTTSRATSPTRGCPGSGSRSGSRAFSPS